MSELIQRIQKMEKLLNEAEQGLDIFENSLQKFKESKKKMNEVEKYYFSPTWRQDKHSDAEGMIPSNIPTGVLSEDGVWNLSVRYNELGIELIKLGVSMIEKESTVDNDL